MKTVSLILPGIPNLLRDILSQCKFRKKYILRSPIFEVPKEHHGKLIEYDTHFTIEHVFASIVGTYGDRKLWSGTIRFHNYKNLDPREWDDSTMSGVKIGEELMMLRNWPKLKVRPFPGEDFYLVLTFPKYHDVKIPFYATKL